MKVQIATAALVLAAVPAIAQSGMTGVSSPEPAAITTSDENTTKSATQSPAGDAAGRRPLNAKPQAGTPASTPAATGEGYGPHRPYKVPLTPPPPHPPHPA